MRSNNNYLGLTALFYTDCLLKPRVGMILFYGRTCQITKSLFSLEFYRAFYKGLTTNIINCPDYPRCNFNRVRVYTLYIYTKDIQNVTFMHKVHLRPQGAFSLCEGKEALGTRMAQGEECFGSKNTLFNNYFELQNHKCYTRNALQNFQ